MSRAVGTLTCRPAALGEAIEVVRPVARLDTRGLLQNDAKEVARMIRLKLLMDSDGYSLYQRNALMRPSCIWKLLEALDPESKPLRHQWPSVTAEGYYVGNLNVKSAVSSANSASWTPDDGRGMSFTYAEYSRRAWSLELAGRSRGFSGLGIPITTAVESSEFCLVAHGRARTTYHSLSGPVAAGRLRARAWPPAVVRARSSAHLEAGGDP
ncbi:hypothetical protein EVAR_35732_1 [Eumeta japonica]|uniref:Uncharacterized protein n=1 Tax=Eumeta variegata TaxID=151549 RepID=A0A4C1VDU6_EUMVA|nr:hypothetical protein EVAR_35732_1 [Eumeta japonica]